MRLLPSVEELLSNIKKQSRRFKEKIIVPEQYLDKQFKKKEKKTNVYFTVSKRQTNWLKIN